MAHRHSVPGDDSGLCGLSAEIRSVIQWKGREEDDKKTAARALYYSVGYTSFLGRDAGGRLSPAGLCAKGAGENLLFPDDSSFLFWVEQRGTAPFEKVVLPEWENYGTGRDTGAFDVWRDRGRISVHKGFVDFSQVTATLQEKHGITGENFIFVSLYISLANSFLEEFFLSGLRLSFAETLYRPETGLYFQSGAVRLLPWRDAGRDVFLGGVPGAACGAFCGRMHL